MIQITTRRHGLIVIAATVDDNRDVTTAIGLTVGHAEHRLLKALG